MYLYTLELEHGCFYVGTTNNPAQRLKQDRAGYGSEWTKHHKAICFAYEYPLQKLKCTACEARLYEDMHLKKVMMQQGVDNVRGGLTQQYIFQRRQNRCY